MSVSLVVLLANLAFFLLWISVEANRRRRGVLPEVPFAAVLLVIAFNTLLFDSMALFRLGAFFALCTAIYEARIFVKIGASELSLAGAIVSGGIGAVILTWWAVVTINEHLNLTAG